MSRRRTLRPEEQEIWHAVARTAKPMHPQNSLFAQRPTAPTATVPPLADVPPPSRLPKFRVGQGVKMTSSVRIAPSVSDSLAQAPLRMDAKTHAKMTRGKLAPESRIDLHGMTLDEAYPALTSFILMARSAGLRLVLVITGKGKSRHDHGPIPQRIGVLRHQVPQWLLMPPLSAAVLQVTEAHNTHGGNGALYVYLRRL